ncbi:hypothetical protein TN53_41730, partial [Streptomyces sp. WM6386]
VGERFFEPVIGQRVIFGVSEIVLGCSLQECEREPDAGAKTAGVHGGLQHRPGRRLGSVVAVEEFRSSRQILRQVPV